MSNIQASINKTLAFTGGAMLLQRAVSAMKGMDAPGKNPPKPEMRQNGSQAKKSLSSIEAEMKSALKEEMTSKSEVEDRSRSFREMFMKPEQRGEFNNEK